MNEKLYTELEMVNERKISFDRGLVSGSRHKRTSSQTFKLLDDMEKKQDNKLKELSENIKNFIEEKFNHFSEINSLAHEKIIEQTTKTNGSVLALQCWQAKIDGDNCLHSDIEAIKTWKNQLVGAGNLVKFIGVGNLVAWIIVIIKLFI